VKNVILLTVDTLRKDVLGCYGGGNLSPFIDSIQDRSIRFNRALSPGPYTQAAFPGILTSSYRLEYGRDRTLSEKRVLISEVLQKAGITTAGFHSNPELSAYFGWNRGWDIFYDSLEVEIDQVDPKAACVKAGELNKKVGAWLSSHVGSGGEYKPFFLWLHYMDVHEPYVPERKYIDMVDPSIRLDAEEMFGLYSDVLFKRDASHGETVDLLKKLYCAHVREIDDGVKDFFGILEALKILKDSILIMTSDHGDEFGEHGGLSHDGKMYGELVNVPLIIYDPSREKSEVCDVVVSTIDIAPTIVRLFELGQVDAFEGHPLLPPEEYPARGVFGEAVDKQGSKERGDEKEIHYYCEGDLKIIYRQRNDSWELYDLGKDPKELNNIVETSPAAEAMKDKVRPRVGRYERVSVNRLRKLGFM
jgi:arylsulfatase A-like enzyme